MKLTGNTILITGGGSGIGRGLAEAFHKLGNKVIISGRRREALQSVVTANPGMEAIELDITSPVSIAAAVKQLLQDHPNLNTVINNAGLMLVDNPATELDDDVIQSQIVTNLMGSIRLTSALVDHLKQQPSATIIYNSSQTAFIPLAMFAVYSATKAGLHSFALSQRFMLKDTNVRVQEIAPPWVGTGLAGDKDDPRAMPLDKFIAGIMDALATDAEEVLVEEAKPFRNAAGPGEHGMVDKVNTFMLQVVSEAA